MRRYVWFFIISAIFLGCAGDIIVPPQGELRGVYKGTYQIIWNAGSGTGSSTDWQYIDWTFTDQKFYCEATDTTLRDRITCDFSGNYTLENKMVFADTIVEPGTCDHDDIPVGEFDFTTISYEGAPDTLRFFQRSGPEFNLTEKTIKLVKSSQ